jgi:hypothetical protein
MHGVISPMKLGIFEQNDKQFSQPKWRFFSDQHGQHGDSTMMVNLINHSGKDGNYGLWVNGSIVNINLKVEMLFTSQQDNYSGNIFGM